MVWPYDGPGGMSESVERHDKSSHFVGWMIAHLYAVARGPVEGKGSMYPFSANFLVKLYHQWCLGGLRIRVTYEERWGAIGWCLDKEAL